MGMFLAFDEVPSTNSSGIKFLDDQLADPLFIEIKLSRGGLEL